MIASQGGLVIAPRDRFLYNAPMLLSGWRDVVSDAAGRFHQCEYDLSHQRPLHASVRNHSVPWNFYNVHQGLEIGLMLAGREERHFANAALELGPGDVWLAAMWELHGVHPAPPGVKGAKAPKVLVFVLLPEFLGDEIVGDLPWSAMFDVPPAQRPRVRSEATRAAVLALGGRMLKEVEEQRTWWEARIRLNLLELLLELRREWAPPRARVAREGQPIGTTQILPALSVIHGDPGGPLSVAEAAALCGISPSHFRLLFRKRLGTSFSHYQLRARLLAASNLLLNTDLPVMAVATRTGFTDASHLHRHFAKEHGCTPAEYRRRFRR